MRTLTRWRRCFDLLSYNLNRECCRGWFPDCRRSFDRDAILPESRVPFRRNMQVHIGLVARFDQNAAWRYTDAIRFDVQLHVSLEIGAPVQQDDNGRFRALFDRVGRRDGDVEFFVHGNDPALSADFRGLTS